MDRYIRPTESNNEHSDLKPYSENSWALIIGIDDYEYHSRLNNAVNDAKAVANILKDTYRFPPKNIIELYNHKATRHEILKLLDEKLPLLTKENDQLIFFFAGHGTTRSIAKGAKIGYIIPQDAGIDQYTGYVKMMELNDACGVIRAKHILLIIDCCFSGIAAITTRGLVESKYPYLKQITKRGSWQVLTAGASDERVADTSVFTNALLDGLRGGADQDSDGVFTASELAIYVRKKVLRDSARPGRKGQTPFFNYIQGSDEGDFVFLLPNVEIRTQQPELPPNYATEFGITEFGIEVWIVVVIVALSVWGIALLLQPNLQALLSVKKLVFYPDLRLWIPGVLQLYSTMTFLFHNRLMGNRWLVNVINKLLKIKQQYPVSKFLFVLLYILFPSLQHKSLGRALTYILWTIISVIFAMFVTVRFVERITFEHVSNKADLRRQIIVKVMMDYDGWVVLFLDPSNPIGTKIGHRRVKIENNSIQTLQIIPVGPDADRLSQAVSQLGCVKLYAVGVRNQDDKAIFDLQDQDATTNLVLNNSRLIGANVIPSYNVCN